MRLVDLIKSSTILLALEPEDLAGPLLQLLVERGTPRFNRITVVPGIAREYGGDYERVASALMEAWAWLEREGLVVPDPMNSGGWFIVSRRGKRLAVEESLKEYRAANRLPRDLMHPVIARACWGHFVRGDFEIAVFAAFREVEIATRRAGGYSDSDVGVPLMRKAFHVEAGPLTPSSAVAGERQALSDLFSGSIGYFKNPHSHRHSPISTVGEAAEAIMLASCLMRVVDRCDEGKTRTEVHKEEDSFST